MVRNHGLADGVLVVVEDLGQPGDGEDASMLRSGSILAACVDGVIKGILVLRSKVQIEEAELAVRGIRLRFQAPLHIVMD